MRDQFGKPKMNSDDDVDGAGDMPASNPVLAAGERRIRALDHRIDSRELFVGTREITIAHGHDIYRLRLTAQNKLILTK
jgi:hemin uptake protein HemP